MCAPWEQRGDWTLVPLEVTENCLCKHFYSFWDKWSTGETSGEEECPFCRANNVFFNMTMHKYLICDWNSEAVLPSGFTARLLHYFFEFWNGRTKDLKSYQQPDKCNLNCHIYAISIWNNFKDLWLCSPSC